MIPGSGATAETAVAEQAFVTTNLSVSDAIGIEALGAIAASGASAIESLSTAGSIFPNVPLSKEGAKRRAGTLPIHH